MSIDTKSLDMFAPVVKSSEGQCASASIYGLTHATSNPLHLSSPEPHDTCEISAIYMQRHSYQREVSLGCWFNAAHDLRDNDLRNCTSALEAKRLIIRKHYNRLSLQVLERYNAGIGKGEGRE